MRLHQLAIPLFGLGVPAFASEVFIELPSNVNIPPQVECLSEKEVYNQYTWDKNPTDQGSLGICYAHAATGIYEANYYQKNNEDLRFSPLMLSFYEKVLDKGSFDFSQKADIGERVSGASINHSLTTLNQMPHCSPDLVEGFLTVPGLTTDPKVALQRLYTFAKIYYEKSRSRKKDEDAFLQAITTLKMDHPFELNDVAEQRLRELATYLDEHGYVQKFPKFNPYFKRTIAQFFVQRCELTSQEHAREKLSLAFNSVVYKAPEARWFTYQLQSKFQNPVDPPVAISIKPSRLDQSTDTSGHALTIYGWRCKDQKLYFLARNSWGGLSMREQREGKAYQVDPAQAATANLKGDFWISAPALRYSMDSGRDHFTSIRLH